MRSSPISWRSHVTSPTSPCRSLTFRRIHLTKCRQSSIYNLSLREGNSVDPILRSARELGVFKITSHGISAEELRSLAAVEDRVLQLLAERDGESRRGCGGGNGSREEIVWLCSEKERMEWAREYIGAELYRSFSENVEIIERKLDGIAEQLYKIFSANASKQFGKRIQRGESVLSMYKHNETVEKNPSERNRESSDNAISLHLPEKQCEFYVQSGRDSFSFHAGPDTIVVTLGQQLEEWSLGEFKCVCGKVVSDPNTQSFFSVEQLFLSWFKSNEIQDNL